MTQSPKKQKQKPKPKNSSKKQSERFIETVRELEADETGKTLEKVFPRMVPPRIKQK
jgi:hypothetical protein